MFLHFGILTYTGSWSKPNLDIKLFNPVGLDPGQWADAAVAAHMKYGVLTTHHHDGFALWPSKASDFNVGHIPWRDGKGDVVREYVDAFRSRGLLAGALLLDLGHHRGRRRRRADARQAAPTSRRSSPSC